MISRDGFASDGESPIYLSELAATVLATRLASYRSDGNPRTCVLCIDDKAAIDALIEGSASSELWGISANLFWIVVPSFPVVWRFWYANTKSNAADPPPRACEAPKGMACTRRSGRTPPESSRIFASLGVLRRESTLV